MVGILGRAVGLRGEVEVVVESDHPSRFEPGSRLLLRPALTPVHVRSFRRHRERAVVSFDEIGDRSGAEALRGRELVVPLEEARPLEAGEYWDHDLLGCRVVRTTGEDVGVVEEILHAPANDVLVVGEHLIPLVGAIVTSVDVARKTIVVDPIPGLLEDSD